MLSKAPDRRYQLIHEVRTDLAVLIDEIEEGWEKPEVVSRPACLLRNLRHGGR